MSDPLSIAASILALMAAAGKTAQGLQKAWELRHIEDDFLGLNNESVNATCSDARNILKDIDKLLEHMVRKKDQASQKQPVNSIRPSKTRWLRRRSAILRLTSQLRPIVASITATANVLRDIASDRRLYSIETTLNIEKVELISGGRVTIKQIPFAPEVQLDRWLHHASELEDTSVKRTASTPKSPPSISRTSSMDSFHSALSSSSESSSSIIAISGSVTSRACEPFCPCQCHIHDTRIRTPTWLRHIIGSMTIHGNSSVYLARRPCNKACQRSGPASLQVAYLAPAWLYLRSLNVYFKAQSLYSNRFVLETPLVIPSTAPVWSIIELGKLSKLQEMLHQRLVSLYDITASGRSLLNVIIFKFTTNPRYVSS
ncbi:hypothetical protein DPSP01_004950 [Paraphaeosphaeria sporulosa]